MKMNEIEVGHRKISLIQKPFIIAEMSGNHNRSLDRALEIVDAAAKADIDAVKIQTYTADTLTIDLRINEFLITEKNSLWMGRSLYELYQEATTPWEWHTRIFDRCKQLGLLAFSTPFDESAADFLKKCGAPCYKVASFENCHIPLLRYIAKTKKPIFLSTGMATIDELDEAVEAIRNGGCRDLVLLKCRRSQPSHVN
jgi:N-acetylneuraminate synthase